MLSLILITALGQCQGSVGVSGYASAQSFAAPACAAEVGVAQDYGVGAVAVQQVQVYAAPVAVAVAVPQLVAVHRVVAVQRQVVAVQAPVVYAAPVQVQAVAVHSYGVSAVNVGVGGRSRFVSRTVTRSNNGGLFGGILGGGGGGRSRFFSKTVTRSSNGGLFGGIF